MKKLTAGIFTVLIGLCAANSADAAVASKGYAEAVADAAQAAAIKAAAADATSKANAAQAAAEQTASNALEAYKTTQADVDLTQTTNISNLTSLVGDLPDGAAATTIVGYITEKTSGIATDAALGELQNTVSTNTANITKNTDAIAKINGDATTEGSFAKAIADSINALSADDGAIKIVADALATHESTAASTYQTKSNIHTTGTLTGEDLNTKYPSVGYVDTAVAGVDADLSGLQTTVAGHTSKIDALEGTVGGYGDIVTKNIADFDASGAAAQALTDAKAYTDELANGAVAANTGEINTLKGTVNDATKGVLANAQKAADNAAAIVTANGKISALETTVNDAEKGVLKNAEKAAQNAAAIAAHTTAISDINNSDVMKSGITAAKVGVVDGINAGGITDAGKYVLTATVGEGGVVSDYKWEIIERSTSTGDEA